jgi:arsenate reductase
VAIPPTVREQGSRQFLVLLTIDTPHTATDTSHTVSTMKPYILYHNPRCSKSRQALQLLRDHGIEPTVVEYLKSPLTADQLAALLKKLKLSARDILRDGEAEYTTLKLADPSKSEQELIQALVAHPVLLQRPIVEHGSKAVVGRPPENIQKLF